VSVLVGVLMRDSTGAIRETPPSPHHDAQHDTARSLALNVAAPVGLGTLNLESGFRSPGRLETEAARCLRFDVSKAQASSFV
jgi:hypothetical protein